MHHTWGTNNIAPSSSSEGTSPAPLKCATISSTDTNASSCCSSSSPPKIALYSAEGSSRNCLGFLCVYKYMDVGGSIQKSVDPSTHPKHTYVRTSTPKFNARA